MKRWGDHRETETPKPFGSPDCWEGVLVGEGGSQFWSCASAFSVTWTTVSSDGELVCCKRVRVPHAEMHTFDQSSIYSRRRWRDQDRNVKGYGRVESIGGPGVSSDIITYGLSNWCPVYLTEPEPPVHRLSGLFLPAPTRSLHEWRPNVKGFEEAARPTSCALCQGCHLE